MMKIISADTLLCTIKAMTDRFKELNETGKGTPRDAELMCDGIRLQQEIERATTMDEGWVRGEITRRNVNRLRSRMGLASWNE